MQNRKQIILETVANLLMELSPQLLMRAAKAATKRAAVYAGIPTSGTHSEVGGRYMVRGGENPARSPEAKEPREWGKFSTEIARHAVSSGFVGSDGEPDEIARGHIERFRRTQGGVRGTDDVITLTGPLEKAAGENERASRFLRGAANRLPTT